MSTAFYCAREGMKVVLLEKQPALGILTTALSTECFRIQFNSPELVDLVRGSMKIMENFGQETGLPEIDINIRHHGYIYVTSDPAKAKVNRKTVQLQHQLGLTDVELLDGGEARIRFPYLSQDVISARYRAGDGWLSVHELVHGFARASQARFLLDTTVIGIIRDRNGIAAVRTDRGAISTRQLVVAAGPFSGRVAEMAGCHLPVTILRRHRLAVLNCSQVPVDAPFTMDDDTGVYWRPEGNGALIGRAYDTEPEEPRETVPTDWTFPAMVLDPDSPYSAGRLSPFWQTAPDLLVKSNLNLTAGQYTYSPDHMPLIGHHPCVPGLAVNTGFSGHGIMSAPEAGRRLALMLAGKYTGENPFRPDRFAEGKTLEAKETVY